MNSFEKKWEELNISRDEVRNIAEALKNEEFRSLLVDYVKETQSSDARKQYQNEIIQLEAERGVDCTFVNPIPGFVVKTSQDGIKKAFINICTNDIIAKPTSKPMVTKSGRGLNWSIPYCQSPGREDFDKKNVRCIVYDVVFHPDTLHLASNNQQFKRLVVDTAVKGVEDAYKVKLDDRNLKFPKLKYKGAPSPAVIRKTSKTSPFLSEEDKQFHEVFKFPTDLPKESKPMVKTIAEDSIIDNYTTPCYDVKHRTDIDIQDHTFDQNSKLNAAIPKELVITIHLPLLNSTKTVDIDIGEKSLDLICESPVKYKLNIQLPYAVHRNGTAKFIIDKKVLEVVLPVVRSYPKHHELTRDDSGVESDNGEMLEQPFQENDIAPIAPVQLEKVVESFLEADHHYQLPSYDVQRKGKAHIIFTLTVRNCEPNSFKTKNLVSDSGFQIKFVSVGSGFFPIHYAFTAKFQSKMTKDVTVTEEDGAIILDVILKAASEEDSIWVGLNEEELSSIKIRDIFLLYAETKRSQRMKLPEMRYEEYSKAGDHQDVEVFDAPDKGTKDEISAAEDESQDDTSEEFPPPAAVKTRTCSEGSGEETTGPVRRSILKNRMTRSLSESCAEEMGGGVLFTWSESCIPTDDDPEAKGEKKTVRFNQHIQRQTFRINSSILGQRRKNQKRTKNKRKALERRMSESENSEEGGDERGKWIKRQSKAIEATETILKPVIINKTVVGAVNSKESSPESDASSSVDEKPVDGKQSEKDPVLLRQVAQQSSKRERNSGSKSNHNENNSHKRKSPDDSATVMNQNMAKPEGTEKITQPKLNEHDSQKKSSIGNGDVFKKPAGKGKKKNKKCVEFEFKSQIITELE